MMSRMRDDMETSRHVAAALRFLGISAMGCLIFFGICGCSTLSGVTPSTSDDDVQTVNILQRLKDQYGMCASSKERLLFCVSLVDANVIGVTKPVEHLRTIFGADAVELSPDSDGFGRVQVSFADYLQIYPVAARSWDGWYLAVSYSKKSGMITRYFLSDIWKSVFMRKWGWRGSPNANQRAVYRSLDAREKLYRSLDIVAPKCDLERTGSKKED